MAAVNKPSAKLLPALLLAAALCGCAGGSPLSERVYEGLRLRNQLQDPLQDSHSSNLPLNYRQ